ncbi:MAG: phospho-sugar mutase [Christensenellaceae bacterium]|jgi:phosphoglucomutase|nr:phospho-sugar mutase [Christensenellaceae bacterium]
MQAYQQAYQSWLNAPELDAGLKGELTAIAGSQAEQEERFYTELEFGTAGLRGILGAGTNRMNVHVVRRATQGLADYLRTFEGAAKRGVAIAYDSRHFSEAFALEAALVLAQNGVRAYLYSTLHSVPQLSYTILRLNCIAGIVITASHNPSEYNGYKVYWEHGGQVGPKQAADIFEAMRRTGYFNVPRMGKQAALEQGLLRMIGQEVDEAYYASIETLLLNPALVRQKGASLKLVYTPLHGSGCVPVREILHRIGIENVSIVQEQAAPDGGFPTVQAPNPEDPQAFTLGEKLADRVGANVILATDPDADRLGVAVRCTNGKFYVLTGNQIGSLLIHYILSVRATQGTLPADGLVVKSIVSTRMANAICAKYGVEIRDVLTGFRFISEQIAACEAAGTPAFLFGFEESYGFLAGSFARDKDAVCAAMLLSEACVYYGEQGKTLYDVLQDMYAIYGYFKESVKAYTLTGKAGIEKIAAALRALREEPIRELAGIGVACAEDLLSGLCTYAGGRTEPVALPKADVLRYTFTNGAWLCVRPSGTEPKLKLYIGANAEKEADLDALLSSLMRAADDRINTLLQ